VALIRFDEYEVDREALELRRVSERVPVPPQAVKALLVLIDAAGSLVPRETLYAQLWPEPDIDVDRALNTLIRQIRIALNERAASPRYIRTYPRRGYRFLGKVQTVERAQAVTAWPAAGDVTVSRARLRSGLAAVVCAGLVVVSLQIPALWPASDATESATPDASEVGLLPVELRETYLEGRYLLDQPLPQRRADAVSRFTAVIAARPDFAQGHAYLADALLWAGRPKESRAAAERALALDPALAHARFMFGTLVHIQDWDWERAERALRDAVKVAPRVPVYHHGYAFLLATAGRHAEAIRELERARSLDHRSALVNGDLGLIYLYAGRYAEAAHACGRALVLEPAAAYAEDCAFEAHARGGDLAAARTYAERIVSRKGGNPEVVMHRGATPGAIHEFRAWRASRAEADLAAGRINAFGAALLLASADRPTAAMDALERAVRERSLGVVTVTVDPRFLTLRHEHRFVALADSMIAHGAAPLGS
jgi:DNA-binding winged helix-turn-helix (wHTH) protein/Tfp pilus assembly protein PilF